MKITVKNSDLNKNSIESINNIMDMDVSVSSAFKLMKVVKELTPLLETKSELEKKITEKHAQKDENGEYVLPLDEEGNKRYVTVEEVDHKIYNRYANAKNN